MPRGSDGMDLEHCMAQWVEAKFALNEHKPKERRKAMLMAFTMLLGMMLPPVQLVQLHLPPMIDHSRPENVILISLYVVMFFFCGFVLLHLRCIGLTASLKAAYLAFFYLWMLVADVCFSNHQWFFLWSVVLGLCEILKSDRDAKLINTIIVAFLSVGLVYAILRTLAHNCVMPEVHPFSDYHCDDHAISRIPIIFELTVSTIAIPINYIIVRLYAMHAERTALTMEKSVEVATAIAKKLINYDLVAAECLLDEANEESPLHEPLSQLLENLRSYRGFLPYALFTQAVHTDPPNIIMAEAMKGECMSIQHAAAAVSRLRDETYSLKDFHSDVTAAFPELRLYSLESSTCSSGHSGFEEYQRTLGALYSVYCLARLDMDGREVMCYGVDENWEPRTEPHGPAAEKMKAFYTSMDWSGLEKLLVRANILVTTHVMKSTATMGPTRTMKSLGGSVPLSSRTVTSQSTRTICNTLNFDRMMSLMVLTAVHDIMKNTNMLPVVQKQHAPYHDLAAGARISDHDRALAYIMEYFPAMLPSYFALEPGQRAPILFTQGHMGFNNGWLVQGEAPPGALFSTFKQVILQGGAGQSDICFYFIHWLTDLAGAEPYGTRPWPGAEKFVIKFPLRVLNAFLESFPYVDRLALQTEVDVMEDYLENRWQALGPPCEGVEEGHQLAARRLALMAQGFEEEVVRALQALRTEDRNLIALEMAVTGRRQQFREAPSAVRSSPAGPALLVYYAPALLQKAGAAEAQLALEVLASVYRAARELFPLDFVALERTAVIRIDALKVLTPSEIAAAKWHLKKTSDADAEVIKESIAEMPPGGEATDIAMPPPRRAAAIVGI